MDTDDIKALCLKHIHSAALTESEKALVDDYSQTPEGQSYLREARQIMEALRTVANVPIKPVDHGAMIQRFEQSVHQTFEKAVIRPRGGTYSLPICLGVLAGIMILIDGSNAIEIMLLGLCVLWLFAAWFQRHHLSKILSRPDLYEYSKASRRRSDKLLRSPWGQLVLVVVGVSTIAAVSYGAHWSYREFGVVTTAVPIVVMAYGVSAVVYQYRKIHRSDPELWDWWEGEIRE